MGSTPVGRAIFVFYVRNVAQLGRALGLGPRGRRFESCLPDHPITISTEKHGALAQLGERLPCTQEVSGSIPLGSTKLRRNTQVRLKGSVLKTDRRVKPCGGSNPSSSAIFLIHIEWSRGVAVNLSFNDFRIL